MDKGHTQECNKNFAAKDGITNMGDLTCELLRQIDEKHGDQTKEVVTLLGSRFDALDVFIRKANKNEVRIYLTWVGFAVGFLALFMLITVHTSTDKPSGGTPVKVTSIEKHRT